MSDAQTDAAGNSADDDGSLSGHSASNSAHASSSSSDDALILSSSEQDYEDEDEDEDGAEEGSADADDDDNDDDLSSLSSLDEDRDTDIDAHVFALARASRRASPNTFVTLGFLTLPARIFAADCAEKRFCLDDPACTPEQLLNGRVLQPWASGSGSASPAPSIPASLEKQFDALIALSPTSSDTLHVCIELVRSILARTASSLRTFRSIIFGVGTKALRLLLEIARLEAVRPRRSEPALPTQPFLQRACYRLRRLHDGVTSIAATSLVARTKHHHSIATAIQQEAALLWADVGSVNMLTTHVYRLLTHSRAPPVSLKLSTAASSDAQRALCDTAVFGSSPVTHAQLRMFRHLPDPRDLCELYALVCGTLLSKPQPASKQTSAEWRKRGQTLCERLRAAALALEPSDKVAGRDWLNEAASHDLSDKQLDFYTRNDIHKWRQHAERVITIFRKTRQPYEWEFNIGSIELQVVIVAHCHFGQYTQAVIWAELLGLHHRELFETDVHSTAARLRLVNALGLISFTLTAHGKALRAFRAAEDAIALLQPLLTQSQAKHRDLMARLKLLSCRALQLHPSPHLTTMRHQRLRETRSLLSAAFLSHPDDTAVKWAIIRAAETAGPPSHQPSVLFCAAASMRHLRAIRPAAFALPWADFVVRNCLDLAACQPVKEVIQLQHDALNLYVRQKKLFETETYFEAMAEAYRGLAMLYDIHAEDLTQAQAALEYAVRYRDRYEVSVFAPQSGAASALCMQTYRAHLHFRLEDYEAAGKAVRAVEDLQSSGSEDISEEIVAKHEYIRARTHFHRPATAAARSHGGNHQHQHHHDLWTADRVLAQSMRRMRMRAQREEAFAVEREPDYARALGLLGAVSAVLGEGEDALFRGRRAVEIGTQQLEERRQRLRLRQPGESQEAVRAGACRETADGAGVAVCDDELRVQVAELHVLYAASLLAADRPEDARTQLDAFDVLLDGVPKVGRRRWAGPAAKTAQGLAALVLEALGETEAAAAARRRYNRNSLHRGFLHDLAPVRRA